MRNAHLRSGPSDHRAMALVLSVRNTASVARVSTAIPGSCLRTYSTLHNTDAHASYAQSSARSRAAGGNHMNLSRLQRVAHMSEARCGGESAQDPGCCFAYPGLRFLLRYAQQ